MKKIILSVLVLVMLFNIIGCQSDPYPAVKSTREERRVVMTLNFDGEIYKVKYELYRALFLSHKRDVDGGDDSVWQGENKEEYINKINDIIIDKASEIYSVFHLAKKLKIKPYSRDMDKLVKERIRISIEGSEAGVIGYGGNYDNYLAALKESNLNYSVQDLLIRYSILLEKINEYYHGVEDDALGKLPGEFTVDSKALSDYYYGDDSVRIMHAYMQEGVSNDTYGKMEEIRQGMISSDDEISMALFIINNTFIPPQDLIVDKKVSGIMVSKNAINDTYSVYKDAAFSLEVGEVSPIIEVDDGTLGYYVLYRLNKDSDHFERCYEDIKTSYLDDLIGKELIKISEGLSCGVEYKKNYEKISHKDISMN